jgi:hypothetical protein
MTMKRTSSSSKALITEHDDKIWEIEHVVLSLDIYLVSNIKAPLKFDIKLCFPIL